MANDTLTLNQQRVYEFIRTCLANGQAPTLNEIASAIDAGSLRSVTQYLEALERKNLIRRNKYAQRGIALVSGDEEPEQELVSLPVFASAGCGSPSIIAERTYGEYVTVAKSFLQGQSTDLFVIKASGRSMIDAGIPDGSFVLVKMTENVTANDLVVAIVDDTAVIKKISYANNAVILSPVTPDKGYEPIIILERDFKVFGKVIKVIKVEADDDYQVVPLERADS